MEMTKYKLGDIAKTGSGGTPKSTVAEYYENGNIPWINSGELNNPFISTTSNFITQKGYDNSSAKLFPSQTVLLAMYGATAGKASLLEFEACTNQAICAIMPNQDILLPRFLKYKLDTMYNYLVGLSTGSARDNLSQDGIKALELCIPPLSEQKKIASVLSALDDKIALNKKMNQKLEAMAKRLYDYWFVQFDFPDKNGHPYKTTGGPMTYNPSLKRKIPAGWADGVLSDIANITMGQSPDGSSYNEDGEGMIFYQGSTDFGMRFPTVRQYTTAPTRFAKKGDILMSVRAPVGAVNIANTDCCIGRGLSALNSKLGSLSHLYFLIDVFKKTFENKNTVGTTFGSITKDELYALPVVIPDKSVIEQFEKMAKPIFDRQMKLGEESNRLTKLRDKLLPLLMNGQVEVN